jgi:hypothetical protein
MIIDNNSELNAAIVNTDAIENPAIGNLGHLRQTSNDAIKIRMTEVHGMTSFV